VVPWSAPRTLAPFRSNRRRALLLPSQQSEGAVTESWWRGSDQNGGYHVAHDDARSLNQPRCATLLVVVNDEQPSLMCSRSTAVPVVTLRTEEMVSFQSPVPKNV
jgi:hypothetical protein